MFGSVPGATSHTFTVPSRLLETRLRPSGANVKAKMEAECPRSKAVPSFIRASQIRIIPVVSPDATVFPSGEKAIEPTSVLYLRRVFNGCPVTASHSWTESTLAEASVLPSGGKNREKTKSRCPLQVVMARRAATSHNRTVVSEPPEARIFPSGEKAKHKTG